MYDRGIEANVIIHRPHIRLGQRLEEEEDTKYNEGLGQIGRYSTQLALSSTCDKHNL